MCPARPLILVVDDDGAIRDSLSDLLQDEGYSVGVPATLKTLDGSISSRPSRRCLVDMVPFSLVRRSWLARA